MTELQNYRYTELQKDRQCKSSIAPTFSKRGYNNVTTVPKLRSYVTFKTEFKTEKYLLLNLSRKERSLMAQLRYGILLLRIETCRYVGESPDERLCKLCDGPAIEDEKHFLLNCSFYNDIRNHFFNSMELPIGWNNLSDSVKLKYL